MNFLGKKRRLTLMTSISAIAMLTTSTVMAMELSGRIVAKSDNSSLEGAIVTVLETNQKVTSDRNGSFRFPNLGAGDYTLSVRYTGAEEATKKVSIGDTDIKSMEIALGSSVDEDYILVVGQRGSLNSSISRQRASKGFANYLSSDGAGNFPDQNIAEATRRIVGLSIENDQGEGRYVVVRGLDSNLNSTSFNGVNLPSPESGSRKVALDVIPSDMLETVEVSKSATPDMDGNFIGANIDVRTITGFDRDELFLKVKGELGYNDLESAYNPAGSITFASPLSEKFAVSGAVSYKSRKFGSHNKESGGGYSEVEGLDVPAMEEMELRDYKITRKRLGAALNLDFRPNDDNELYVRTIYTNFEDQEYRDRMEISFDKGDVDLAQSNGQTVYSQDFRVDRELKSRLETQKIYSFVAGGESYADRFKIEYSASYAHAEEKEPDRLDIAYRQSGLNGGVNYANPLMPSLVFNGNDKAGLENLSGYELNSVEWVDGVTEDDQWAFKFDVTYDAEIGGMQGFFKSGVKYSTRKKTSDVNFVEYEDFDEGGFAGSIFDGMTLADVAAPIDYDLESVMGNTGINTNWTNTYLSDLQKFGGKFDINDAHEDAFLDDFTVEEDIIASYVMGSLDIGELTVVGGVRWEHTNVDTLGNVLEEGDVEGITQFTQDRSYDDFLPSVNFKYNAADDVIIRGAYYRTVVRPTFSDVVPAGAIEFEDGVRSGSLGNPNLDPYNADNIDLGVEWYPNNDSLISAGVFYKKLGSFIYNQGARNVTYLGRRYDDLTIPKNGESAEIKGLELSVQTSLTMLPAPFDGFLVGANYTYVDSEATVEDGDGNPYVSALPRTSSNIANFIVGYEKGGFSSRVALSYQSEYLDELFSEGDDNRYVRSHFQVDLQTSYEIYKGLEVYGEISNLNNRPYHAVLRHDNKDYLGQFEQYSWTGNVGFKFKY